MSHPHLSNYHSKRRTNKAEAGTKGGQARTEAKRQSSRANAAKARASKLAKRLGLSVEDCLEKLTDVRSRSPYAGGK